MVRVFVSFDFDYDEDLRTLLVGQAKHPDTPFSIADWSVKAHIAGDWKEKVRARIRAVDQVVVLCGHNTDIATGVAIELEMARDERRPYFLLSGRKDGQNTKPANALSSDIMYDWTWDNLGKLFAGRR